MYNAISMIVGTVMTLGLVPQMIKIIEAKSSKGVSSLSILILLLGSIWYAIEASVVGRPGMILRNIGSVVLAIAILYLIRKYQED